MEKEAGVVGLLMGFLGGASAAAYLVASAGQEVRGGRLKGQRTSFGMFFPKLSSESMDALLWCDVGILEAMNRATPPSFSFRV